MTCGHCQKPVEAAIGQVDGVQSVRVDLKAAKQKSSEVQTIRLLLQRLRTQDLRGDTGDTLAVDYVGQRGSANEYEYQADGNWCGRNDLCRLRTEESKMVCANCLRLDRCISKSRQRKRASVQFERIPSVE